MSFREHALEESCNAALVRKFANAAPLGDEYASCATPHLSVSMRAVLYIALLKLQHMNMQAQLTSKASMQRGANAADHVQDIG
jgi:hypothetical protein